MTYELVLVPTTMDDVSASILDGSADALGE
jgi:hypothetical protein